MKATEQYFHVVLFITCMLYKVVLTFFSVDETLVCDYRAVLSCGGCLFSKFVDKTMGYDHLNESY